MMFTALAGCADSGTDPVDKPKDTSTFETLHVEFLAESAALDELLPRRQHSRRRAFDGSEMWRMRDLC